jgi:hypothetical protein
MILCVNCGNNIKTSISQIKLSTKKYEITGCPRWRYYIKCDCCNKRNDYTNFINHKLLFTPTLLYINNLYRGI